MYITYIARFINKLFTFTILLLFVGIYIFNVPAVFSHGDVHNPVTDQTITSDTAAGPSSVSDLAAPTLPSFFNFSNWYFDPTLVLIFLLALFYTRYLFKTGIKQQLISYIRIGCFYTGLLVLIVSLSSPLDFISDYSFMAHMVQHLGLTLVGAPLIVLGRPFPYVLRGMDGWVRSKIVVPISKNKPFRKLFGVLLSPYVAAALYALNMWLWHYPFLYNAALHNELAHMLQHFLFFYTATAVWWNIFPHQGQVKSYGISKIPYMIITVLFDNLLGAILTISNTSFYDFKFGNFLGLSVLEHQKTGGAVMWIGGMLVHLAIMGVLFVISVNQERSAVDKDAYSYK